MVTIAAEDVLTGQVTHMNFVYLVCVASDENGQLVGVPPLIAETAEQERWMMESKRRQ